MDTELSIAELADAAAVSPRTVRFYVQQGLLPPPEGAGRGSHYTPAHRETLRRIAEYQRAGYSLDAIRRLLKGETLAPSAPPLPPLSPRPPRPPRPAQQAVLAATLMSRIELADGVELSFDAARFRPDVEGLQALQELARRVFRP
jgi:DNA-binding transcriptional MerR regulator